jgi:phage gpG-like protein
MLSAGSSPRSHIDLVLHFKDLERMGLVDNATGDALIRPGDRLSALPPPSQLTLAARQMHGRGGSKALLVRGDLRNSITAVVKGDQAFVGVPRKARGKDGKPLIDVAQVQEFGAGPTVIPMTPAMRRFLFLMLRRAGKPRQPGSGRGVVVVTIPARPFLRPAFKRFSKGVRRRFLNRVARVLAMGGR